MTPNADYGIHPAALMCFVRFVRDNRDIAADSPFIARVFDAYRVSTPPDAFDRSGP